MFDKIKEFFQVGNSGQKKITVYEQRPDQGRLLNISFQNIFFSLGSIILIAIILKQGQQFLMPLLYAMLMSFILLPVCQWWEGKGVGRIWSIIWTMLSVSILFLGITTFFSTEIVALSRDLRTFSQDLYVTLEKSVAFIAQNVPVLSDLTINDFGPYITDFLTGTGGEMVSSTLGFTGALLSSMVLAIIYTFLILLYRTQLVKAFVGFAPREKSEIYLEMLVKIQKVGKQYLFGIFTVMLILGSLNSLGLFIIGLDSPVFFGFLAALLAIIPYIGTTMGALLPVLYSALTMDSLVYPLIVMLYFWMVQFFEGNVLTPRIVGGNLKINALFSILALIAGGYFWGISGMILALPLVAILKIITMHYHELEHFSDLLGEFTKGKKAHDLEKTPNT